MLHCTKRSASRCMDSPNPSFVKFTFLAILSSTPALLGLFSMVVLLAHHLPSDWRHSDFQSAWHQKSLPTFSNALASVRQ